MTGFYDAQVREQLREANDKIKHLKDVVRFLIEDSAQTETARARFLGAWQSTIVEARRQAARAEQAEARIAGLRQQYADEHATAITRAQETDRVRQQLGTAETRIAAVRAAVHVADAEDVTDWQRGYRACSDHALAALDSPAAPEQPACCVCGTTEATYFNYLNLAFCPLCADCQCGQTPCERTGVNDPAVSSTAAAAEPCTGRPGFCRPCRTLHSVPQFGPTVLPGPVAPPTLAAMAQLAERAHAAFLVEQLQLEAAIVTAVEAARLTIVRSGPVEEVAAHPGTVSRLKTALWGCFERPDVPSTPGLPSPVGRLTDLPVIADWSLPAGEVHLRPHPRTTTGPS